MNIEKSSQTEWHGRIFAVSALSFVLFLFLLLRQQCGIPFGELGHLKMSFPSAEQMEQWHAEQKKAGDGPVDWSETSSNRTMLLISKPTNSY